MKKIAIVFLLFAVVLSCDPTVEAVIQGEDVVLEAGLTDYIELLKCLLGHEELIKDVTDVYEAIVAGDYQKLLALAMKLYTDGKAAIDDCLKSEEDQPVNLTFPARDLCLWDCSQHCGKDYVCYRNCSKHCPIL